MSGVLAYPFMACPLVESESDFNLRRKRLKKQRPLNVSFESNSIKCLGLKKLLVHNLLLYEKKENIQKSA